MSKIDYQALREAAQKAKELGNISRYTKAMIAMLEFKEAATPDAVLALLDELDKWKQESSAWQAVAEKQLALATNAEQKIAELESLTAPQLPQTAVAVPDEMTPKQASRSYCGEVRGYRDGWNACRAAMLHCSEQETDNTNQQFESLSRGDK